MGLDIRFPLGLIFAILGGIMAVYGLVTRNSTMYAQAGDININLWWGLIMFVLGTVTLLWSRRKA